MKKIYSLLLAICFVGSLHAQRFFTNSCGTIIDVTANCPATFDAEIDVSGIGPLGVDNFGIVEVFVDLIMPTNSYKATVSIVAPDGTTFQLTNVSDTPNPSFPNATNGFINTAFRLCAELPFHNDNIGMNPNNGTFQPFEDFTQINDMGVDPNGTWTITLCGLPDDFQFVCGRIEFGQLCPEITEVEILNAPLCAGDTNGEIKIKASQGACMNYYFINNGAPTTDSIFTNITTGDLTATVLDANSGTARSSVAFCRDDEVVTIEPGDTEGPEFTNCPTDFTISVDSDCNHSFPVTDPLISDDCGISSSELTVTFVTGGTATFPVAPGETFDYGGAGTGTLNFIYTATDVNGNTSTCEFDVTVIDDEAPQWTNQFVSVDGVCGVDDPVNLLLSVQSQLSGTDNCSTPSVIATFNDVINNICGGSDEYVYEFKLTDNSGNDATEFGYVTVNLTDNIAPVLTGIPADVTINCNDAFPTMPAVTAMDNCAGDLTSQIVITDSVVEGNCDLNSNAAVVTYTWAVDDGCNNSISVNWNITIFNDEAVDLGDDIAACAGDAVTLTAGGLTGDYLWSTGETTSSITVTTADTYTVEVIGNSGCCSMDEINVSFGNIPTASATGGTLDCTGGDLVIMGASSIPNVTYSWTGPGGYSSTEQNPSVNQVGTYTLTVSTPEGCTDQADAIVDADTDVPDITTQGDFIDCQNTVATISGNSTTPGVQYSWVGPNGYTSTDPVNSVTEPGDYFLTVTAPNGCLAEGIAVVEQDDDVPSLLVEGGEINCNNSSVILEANPSSPNVLYDWTGPNGFTSDEANPEVTVAGTYVCTITAANGCDATDQADVTEDTDVPDVTANGGTLTCVNTNVQLNSSSSASNVSYQWSGPNGFSSTEQNPIVDLEGQYTLNIMTPNGCTNMATVSVNADVTTPDLMAQGGDIGCDGAPIMINATSNTNGVSYAWTGPDNFTSTQASPTVGTAGMYTILVTAANGCTNTTTVTVTADAATPVASLNVGAVDCDNNNRILAVSASDPNYTYAWTRDGTAIGNSQEVTISEAGTYNVVVSSAACSVTFEFIQEENIQALQTDIQATEATASSAGTATIEILNSSLDVMILWDNGQTGTTATDLTVGDHTVTVTNAFGCVFTYEFEILLNTSVRELEDIISWEFYPTLTSDCVNLKAQFSTAKTFQIQVINMNGNVVHREEIGRTNQINKCIDFSHFANGLYMLSIRSEKEIRTTKIVKM